jgi:hypothetical protein
MGAGKKYKTSSTKDLPAPVADGRRRPQRKAAVPAQKKGPRSGFRTDAAREVALEAEREQKMRVAARQQAMAHARAAARARSQKKVIAQARSSFNASTAAEAAEADDAAAPEGGGGGARVHMEPSSTPDRRPESPKAGAPGSGARGFRHPSNRRASPATAAAASPPPAAVDEASGLLAAGDSGGAGRGAGGGTGGGGGGGGGGGEGGLTFVEELDLAAARLERMGAAGGDARAGQDRAAKTAAVVQQQPPRGSHNSRDLSAPTAWELCIKNSELTMDEDEDKIGMGGTGTVYKALWCGAPVAVKKIYYGDEPDDHDPASLESLKKEADILATLRHPNIVLFLGASFAPPNIFLVSELIIGPRGHNNGAHTLRVCFAHLLSAR